MSEEERQVSAFMEEVMKHLLRSPNLLYWSIPKDWKKTRYAFGWTAERDSDGKFRAFKYRILRDGTCKLIKSLSFAKRRIAKARSRKWFERHYESKKSINF